MFSTIENHVERVYQQLKVEKVKSIYSQISEKISNECNIIKKKSKRYFNEELYASLSMLVYY